jgi:two-component SAPR family response regulator
MHTIGLPTSERRQIGYQVLDIYQGDFLSDLDMPWIDERRNELARQFDDCLTHLASLEFEEAHFDNARRLFQTLISRDSFQEENHMGYMRALIALKDRVSAKHHYEQYSAQLREEMGLEPGSEMTQLYQSL